MTFSSTSTFGFARTRNGITIAGLMATMLGVASLTGCASGNAREQAQLAVLAEPVVILDSGSANSTAFTEVGHHVFNDVNQFPEGYIPPVGVDFETQSLLIVALGPQPSGSGLTIGAIQREGARLVVSGSSYGPSGASVSDGATDWPYAWALINRADGSWVDVAID